MLTIKQMVPTDQVGACTVVLIERRMFRYTDGESDTMTIVISWKIMKGHNDARKTRSSLSRARFTPERLAPDLPQPSSVIRHGPRTAVVGFTFTVSLLHRGSQSA